jgi:hypothetical protein
MQQAVLFPQILCVARRHVFPKKVKPRRGSEFVRMMSLVSPAEYKEGLAGFLINETDKTIEQPAVFGPHDVRVAPPIAR